MSNLGVTPLQFESVNNNEYNEDIVNNPASTQHEVAACSRILQAFGDTAPSLRKMPTHLIAVQEWKKHVQRNGQNFVPYFFQGCESFLIFLHFFPIFFIKNF